MLARTIVLDGESVKRFVQMLGAFTAEFQLATEAEMSLVESMAIARWRQMRLWGIGNTASIAKWRARTPPPSSPERAAIAFRHLSDNSRYLDLVHRYETSYERQFSRAIKDLIHLQANRGDVVSQPYIPGRGASPTWEHRADFETSQGISP